MNNFKGISRCSFHTIIMTSSVLGVSICCANLAYADTTNKYERCLPHKVPDVSTTDVPKVEPNDTETASTRNNLLFATANDDPFNIPKLSFEKVAKTHQKKAHPVNSASMNLTTGSADSRVSISTQWAQSKGEGRASFSNLSFSAPVAKTGDTQLAKVGDFSSDAKIKFSHFWTSKSWNITSWTLKEQNALKKNILQKMKKMALGDAINCNEECQKNVKSAAWSDVLIERKCLKDFADTKLADSYNNRFQRTSSNFIGGSAAIGSKEFEYKNMLTDEDIKKTKTPWSLEIFAGRYFDERKSMVRAGYTYVEDYKASDPVFLCQTPGSNGVQECESIVAVGPKDDQTDSMFVEFRRKIENFPIKAATVKVSYDFDEKQTEVDVPMYLFADEDKNINGGIRLGWNKKDDIQFGVFVGSSFSLGN